jgi:glutamine amidotransferase
MENIHAVVLPGVGAFGDCVRNLRERELWEPLRLWIESGRKFLGICLGYQLLFESSEETPGEAGFGFFAGKVRRFKENGLKVPHMGWNNLSLAAPSDPLWRGVPADPFVFFVHSYFPAPEDESIVTSRATYGETFAASVAKGNVAAVQFHPEKSQAVGLTILRNFVASLA